MIINELKKLGLSELEAKIYLELLKNESLNGSQLAKILQIPRTSAYSALDKLYQKAIVFLSQGESIKYTAKNPDILLEELRKDYLNSINSLKEEFKKIDIKENQNQYWTLNGEDNFIKKTKELLNLAENEVYINTNYNLEIFEKEIQSLNKKGVRIIHFTFEEQNKNYPEIELYYNNFGRNIQCEEKRMMLVIDMKIGLISNGNKSENFISTFSENQLFIKIIAEHIHHDIYIFNFEKKYGRKWDKDIKLNSLLEKSGKHFFKKMECDINE